MRKSYFIFIILALSLLAVLVIALIEDEQKTIELTIFEKSYNQVSLYQDSEEICFDIYLNTKDSYLTDIDNITSASITDDIQNQLLLKKNKIIITSEKLEINDEIFYLSKFYFFIDFVTEDEFSMEIKKAYLSIDYVQDENIKLAIGPVSFYKVPSFSNEDISISMLKGVVNEIYHRKTLVAIQLGIRNNTDYDLKITSVEPLDLNVNVSNSDVQAITSEIAPNESIDKILGYNYILVGETQEQLSLGIIKNNNNKYLFPLKYLDNLPINRLGLKITYEINNQQKVFYYDDFTFYSNSLYTESEMNSLIIYTYENH